MIIFAHFCETIETSLHINRSSLSWFSCNSFVIFQVLGDLVESCIGALFLDTGFDLKHVWKQMLFLLDPIISFSKLQFNPLRELHELCQHHNWELQFSSVKRDGKFSVEAKVENGKVSAIASATNTSGKVAKKMAARQVFECLKVIFSEKSNFLVFVFLVLWYITEPTPEVWSNCT